MATDHKAYDLARKARRLSNLAHAAADHRLTDMTRLDRAISETRDLMDDFTGKPACDTRDK